MDIPAECCLIHVKRVLVKIKVPLLRPSAPRDEIPHITPVTGCWFTARTLADKVAPSASLQM